MCWKDVTYFSQVLGLEIKVEITELFQFACFSKILSLDALCSQLSYIGWKNEYSERASASSIPNTLSFLSFQELPHPLGHSRGQESCFQTFPEYPKVMSAYCWVALTHS